MGEFEVCSPKRETQGDGSERIERGKAVRTCACPLVGTDRYTRHPHTPMLQANKALPINGLKKKDV
jgi:hypothetical protein